MLGLLLLLVGCGILAAVVVGLIEIKKGIVKALRRFAAFIEKRSEDLPPPTPTEEEIKEMEEEKTRLLASRIRTQFKELKKVAKELPQDTYYDSLLSKKLETRFKEWSRGKKQLNKALNDQERAYRKAMEGLIEEYGRTQEITPEFLLERYRSNNETLETAFEPTKLRGELKGEQQAALEVNEAIREIITENFSDTKFGEDFNFIHKHWCELVEAEVKTLDEEDYCCLDVPYHRSRHFLFDEDDEE